MIYTLAIIFSVVFMLSIIILVRNNKLEEKYSLLWLIFGIGIIILSIFPNIIDKLAKYFNIIYPPSLIFLFAFIVLAIYIIHLSVIASKQNKRIIKLSQEIAIDYEKIEKLEKNCEIDKKKCKTNFK